MFRIVVYLLCTKLPEQDEIPIPTCRDQPEMIMWVFHLAIKKQIINR